MMALNQHLQLNAKEPHQTHNDGKNVDIGFGGLNNMNQQLRLLRDVIIDNGGQLPYDTEGRDMSNLTLQPITTSPSFKVG